ncbi:MAG: HK97 family phage prohead protease [Phycicoccus sp.]
MGQKSLSRVELKAGDRGEVAAVFATFDVVDKDGDVTVPGAFTDGEEVLISSYQHTSWQGSLPVGKGTIRTTKSEAILDGQFFMDTSAGRDTFAVVKALGERQQWSYGFDVVDAAPGVYDGRDVQILKRLKVHEVSPVLIGAGVNTRTLATKALMDSGFDARDAARLAERTVIASEYRAAIRPHETVVTEKAWTPAEVDPGTTIADLRSVHAWCDPNGDPELKSSYLFAHHHGPNEEANLRACLLGIAQLNGAKGAPATPEADRRGVYNHLAAHLQDGDIEPPELRDPGASGPLKFHEEVDVVMADVHHLNHRASEVMALRAKKGKSLASTSIKRLEWLYDEMRDLRARLDSPQDDAAREYLRFVQSQLNNGEQT